MNDDETKQTRKLFDELTSASGEAKMTAQRKAAAGAALDVAHKAWDEASAKHSNALDAEANAREALAVHIGLRK